MAVCGTIWNADTWAVLMRDATRIALVMDLQAARAQSDRDFALAFARTPTVATVGCVVWTKDDLIAAGVERASPTVLAGTKMAAWPSFVTRFDRPETLLEPLEWLLRQ